MSHLESILSLRFSLRSSGQNARALRTGSFPRSQALPGNDGAKSATEVASALITAWPMSVCTSLPKAFVPWSAALLCGTGNDGQKAAPECGAPFQLVFSFFKSHRPNVIQNEPYQGIAPPKNKVGGHSPMVHGVHPTGCRQAGLPLHWKQRIPVPLEPSRLRRQYRP